jgi:DNA-binding response OmpR family regulator
MSRAIPMILCVNNNPDTLELLTVILKYEGYQIILTQSKISGLIKALSGIFNLFILDVDLADGSGIDLCREIREFDKKTPIIFYSADDLPKNIEEAMRAGAQAYLRKLVIPNVLLETVARLLNQPG